MSSVSEDMLGSCNQSMGPFRINQWDHVVSQWDHINKVSGIIWKKLVGSCGQSQLDHFGRVSGITSTDDLNHAYKSL